MNFERLPKSDLHTHTRFCDGDHTPEEMVRAAISLGMDTLGFSGHSTVRFASDACMSREATAAYIDEVNRLKAQYDQQLHILLGIEQDYYADTPAIEYDYIIGSVHYVRTEGQYFAIDADRETLIRLVREQFSGDFYRFAKHYFELTARLVERTGCHIVGHFDLLTKFNRDGSLFDEKDPRYLRAALDALDALLEKDVIFEINTGDFACARRRVPYPAPILLHRIAEKRGHVTLSSDAHSCEMLLTGFRDALMIARAAGLGAVRVMTRNGWKSCSL